MAAGTVPQLGEPITCDEPCRHKDCEEIRALVGSPCRICGTALKSGQRYFRESDGQLTHEVCAMEEAED